MDQGIIFRRSRKPGSLTNATESPVARRAWESIAKDPVANIARSLNSQAQIMVLGLLT
jgi:hypothetical protein